MFRIIDECKVNDKVSDHFTMYLNHMVDYISRIRIGLQAKFFVAFSVQVTVEVLRGDHLEKISVTLEPMPDQS